MRISLSAPDFDINGQVYIDAFADSQRTVTRRVTRTATLDGGVAITDGGFSHGDETLNYTWRTVNREHLWLISSLQENYPLVVVSNRDGCFSAAIETLSPGPAESSIVLLVKEKLTS